MRGRPQHIEERFEDCETVILPATFLSAIFAFFISQHLLVVFCCGKWLGALLEDNILRHCRVCGAVICGIRILVFLVFLDFRALEPVAYSISFSAAAPERRMNSITKGMKHTRHSLTSEERIEPSLVRRAPS